MSNKNFFYIFLIEKRLQDIIPGVPKKTTSVWLTTEQKAFVQLSIFFWFE